MRPPRFSVSSAPLPESIGLMKGESIGLKKGQANAIRAIMDSMHLSVQQAMDALKIPAEEQAQYAAML